MNEKSCIMLRILLNRYHKGAAEAFLKGLPEDETMQILNIPISSGEIAPLLATPQEKTKKIHYSWFEPLLKNAPKDLLPIILSLLPEPHQSKLKEKLNITSKAIPIADSMKSFLTSRLYHTFKLDDVYPLEYLPETEMTVLAQLKKNDLVNLIDYLGLYDLAEEVHHIVDKKILEKIYQCLTHKKHVFLRKCLHLKEKLVTSRLGLEKWDGDGQKLAKLLHHRGMVRLGYALSGQEPGLIWHITHILDTGRGEKLSRFCQKEEIPGVTNSLKKQVKHVIKFIKQESEA